MTAKQPRKSRSTKSADNSDIGEMSYEQAVDALETLIEKIESGEIGLEESIKAYERGIALRNHCQRMLEQAEQRFAEITPSDADSDATSERAET